jgi:hypothetical protein
MAVSFRLTALLIFGLDYGGVSKSFPLSDHA